MFSLKSAILITILFCVPSIINPQPPDFGTLGTDKPEIRPARFHCFQVFTGLDETTLSENADAISGVIKSFEDDFHVRFPAIATTVHITPLPTPDLFFKGRAIGKDTVMQGFENLDKVVEKDDVIFCYMMAHGEYIGNELSLHLGTDVVPRKVFVDRLKAIQQKHGARLIVFITDNCSISSTGQISRSPTDSPGIWRALYFGHQGFLDLTSTSKNQYGFVVGGKSIFSEAFRRSLSLRTIPETEALRSVGNIDGANKRFLELLDTNKDGIVSWQEFEIHLEHQMEDVYLEALASAKSTGSESKLADQGCQDFFVNENPSIRER